MRGRGLAQQCPEVTQETDGQEEAKDGEAATQEGTQESSATHMTGFLPPGHQETDQRASLTGPGASPTPSLRPGPSPTLGTLGPHPPHDDTVGSPDVRDGGHTAL